MNESEKYEDLGKGCESLNVITKLDAKERNVVKKATDGPITIQRLVPHCSKRKVLEVVLAKR